MYTSYFYHAEKLDMYLEIVTVDDTYVCRIDYVDDPEDKNTDDLSDVAKACFNELDLYFDNKLETFTFPIKYMKGTLFQQSVWDELRKIPFGETLSYKELALKCGGANYSRAVANANGKNPISIVIPCHRVISSDGTLGGYTSGTDKKQALLDHEGVIWK
ncbi:MAG TPA: methylated-DNA--[protein]-cysteine S-methyltransferase [Aliicoccus persicus]|uniref:methylated-DNA--[protein]-cysteine S-methyltransferase n=1 Tax=Aliicoccus persicus TaxID=930138 RepID=A0A921DXI6_9STAP|nr:methylated-DNA--[protein]-cysteine S-methyltransferase [Aliicoccus persicus]